MRLSHIAWNLAGLSVPLLVAAVSVPPLMAKIGNERFGLLALAWGLIGYAGALDLGVGRALTQMVARLRGEGKIASIPQVLATAGRITLISGVTGGLIIAAVALTGGSAWIATHTTPRQEVVAAMLLLAIALPAQAMSATYRGLNEAYQNFRGISLLRAGLGVVTFGGPFLVAQFSPELPYLVSTLVLSRLLALGIFRRLALGCLEHRRDTTAQNAYSATVARSLFAFAGWITVSAIVTPLLVQADRFVIASKLSASAVTTYVLPYELVVQMLIVSGAISSAIFPSLSRMLGDRAEKWRPYFYRWLSVVAVIMAGCCSALALLLPVLLRLWLKTNLDAQSIVVGQILCLGVFANSLGAMFYALLHARGRPDITARLHLVELPLFLVALVALLGRYGVVGAAVAWTGRMIFDSTLLAYCARSRHG